MSLNEALRAPTPMGADLDAGLDTLSYNQKIRFEPYVRVVLPLDGFVFWIKASTLSPGALINAMGINVGTIDTVSRPTDPAPFIAPGSLHYAIDSRQTDDSNYSANRVVFTSQVPVQNLNAIAGNVLYVGTFDGPDGPLPEPNPPANTTAIKFAFSSRGGYYRQAGLHHYVGYALYSTMDTQLIDDPRQLSTQLIVSNSLPLWLNFAMFDPPWPVPVPRPAIPFFPSLLVPENLRPPFVSVRINEGDTSSVQTQPTLTSRTNQYQLATDRVELTIYGANNQVAQDLLYSIEQHSYDTGNFGIVNIPVVRDDKEGQNEFNILAQKKRITVEVSYNQSTVRDVARQLIKSCISSYFVGDVPVFR